MKIFVISLGGSLIVPDEIDVVFLKKFKSLIEKYVKKGFRFVLMAGGGKTARKYMSAVEKISKLHTEDVDWLGIHATRINAHLLRSIFKMHAHSRIIRNPKAKFDFKKSIIVAGGWQPGSSSDYDAVLLAKTLNVKTVLNLSNIEYAYDKDPKKFKDAKKIKKISWVDFRKIVGDKWVPGSNLPFDPIASREAANNGVSVIIANGKNLKNLENIFLGKDFKGTIIG
ncbi:UMP kinase [Candidatus Woesearchaeota archaeon]|jgi:uridylate kinase|nr:UMP kinase [Candidatus Woesearchaeota archaeon]|tara:strand:+ start:1814 stop:2491 length:678 start_codon:yes stop_codon:yes gene_type:complete